MRTNWKQALLYLGIACQLAVWGGFSWKAGKLDDREFIIFTVGMLLGQLCASIETWRQKSWGTFVVQLFFFCFTAYAGVQRTWGWTPEVIGKLSGLLVVLSVIPYGWRVYQRKTHPNLTSWSLWSFIGLSLLLTYKSSGAKDNIWPSVFGFINPSLVTFLAWWRREKPGKMEKTEKICLTLGLTALGMWWLLRGNRELVQYALYVAIAADMCAAIPTLTLYWKEPGLDRPAMWLVFALGYGLAIFAITEKTFANYILPIYMFLGSGSVAVFLALPRIRQQVPLKEWI